MVLYPPHSRRLAHRTSMVLRLGGSPQAQLQAPCRQKLLPGRVSGGQGEAKASAPDTQGLTDTEWQCSRKEKVLFWVQIVASPLAQV